MRMKIGDQLIVCDQKRAFYATVTSFHDSKVEVLLNDELPSNELPYNITIGIGMMNNKKIDFLIQK